MYYYFTYPVEDHTNFHSYFKEWGHKKKRTPTPGARKNKQRKTNQEESLKKTK